MKALGHPNVAQPFHSLVLKIPRSLHTMSASLSPLGGESAPNSDLECTVRGIWSSAPCYITQPLVQSSWGQEAGTGLGILPPQGSRGPRPSSVAAVTDLHAVPAVAGVCAEAATCGRVPPENGTAVRMCALYCQPGQGGLRPQPSEPSPSSPAPCLSSSPLLRWGKQFPW